MNESTGRNNRATPEQAAEADADLAEARYAGPWAGLRPICNLVIEPRCDPPHSPVPCVPAADERLSAYFPGNDEPGWSPDSRWICFTAVQADGGLDVYAMRVDASAEPMLLAGGPAREQACAWRPGHTQ